MIERSEMAIGRLEVLSPEIEEHVSVRQIMGSNQMGITDTEKNRKSFLISFVVVISSMFQ